MDDCLFLPASTLAAMVRRREISSAELVGAYLDRLLAIHPLLNSALEYAPESAMEQARAADASVARGEDVGPLHGIPFTVKDVVEVDAGVARLVPVPGMATRPEPVQPNRSEVAVRRLREAGAIVLGVTRATLWGDREERYGPVNNPYDRARTASGSSGGEAATVAAGGSAFGLGTDSGGSLRLPAHCCGIVTLRPSNCRVPRASDAEGTNDPRTVLGPLTRSVADAALITGIIGGYTPEDPTTLPLPPIGDYRAVPISGMRVAFFTDNGLTPPTPEMGAIIRAAARALEGRGAHVDEMPLPDAQESWDVTLAYWHWCGAKGEVADYFRFLERWDRYRVTFLSAMADWDVLLCPTEAYPAPVTNTPDGPPSFTYTVPFSLVGVPCAVVRARTSPEGMPLSIQCVANPLQDHVALAVAGAIEDALGGYRPPLL